MKGIKYAVNRNEIQRAQKAAIDAASVVGALLRRHLREHKRANEITQHDIKLELDVRSQRLIEDRLHSAFPDVALLGEEGEAGEDTAPYRWVVDPIDGTVNFAYGIPHACVSIALQKRVSNPREADFADGYQTLTGVIYDPFREEMWSAVRGQPARLNSKPIQASGRGKLQDTILSVGFAKTQKNLEATLPYFNQLAHRVRKIRIMGSAALDLAYVATGRFDAYIENGVRIWDIAAGALLVRCAGGKFWQETIEGSHAYRMIASNGHLHKKLHQIFREAWGRSGQPQLRVRARSR